MDFQKNFSKTKNRIGTAVLETKPTEQIPTIQMKQRSRPEMTRITLGRRELNYQTRYLGPTVLLTQRCQQLKF